MNACAFADAPALLQVFQRVNGDVAVGLGGAGSGRAGHGFQRGVGRGGVFGGGDDFQHVAGGRGAGVNYGHRAVVKLRGGLRRRVVRAAEFPGNGDAKDLVAFGNQRLQFLGEVARRGLGSAGELRG